MLDLRTILWFIMGFSFFVWSFILIFRINKLWKQWFISLGIWFSVLIVQISTKNIVMPSYTFLEQLPDNTPMMTKSLHDAFPSFLIVIIPISGYLLYQNIRAAKKQANTKKQIRGEK